MTFERNLLIGGVAFIGIIILGANLSTSPEQAGGVSMGFALMFMIALIYFAPAVVAWKRPQFGSVLALNFFLGWTLVGWVVALAWALKSEPQPTQVVVQQSHTPQMPSQLCVSCGKYSAWEARFCQSCGHSFPLAVAK